MQDAKLVPIEDLSRELTPGDAPREVTLEGVIQCDSPIQTEHKKEGKQTDLVSYTLTKIVHYASHNAIGGWRREQDTGEPSYSSVPFQVTAEAAAPGPTAPGPAGAAGPQPARPSVHIPALDQATVESTPDLHGLIRLVSDVKDNTKYTLNDLLNQIKLQGRVVEAAQHIESGIEVGSRVTLLGPVALKKNGELRMVGQPSVVSRRSPYELIEDAKRSSKTYRTLFYTCTGIAVACFGYLGYLYFRKIINRRAEIQRLRNLRERRRAERKKGFAVDGKEAANGPSCTDGKSTDYDEEDEKRLCVVCQENPANAVIMDCGHLYTCTECTQKLNPRICPICRCQIKKVIRVYKHDT